MTIRVLASLAGVAAALATSIGCGPPTYIHDTNKIDAWLSQGNFAYACAGLTQTDDHVREHTAAKLTEFPAEPVARDCLCAAVYDAETGRWDPVIAAAAAGSHHAQIGTCLAKAVDDARVTDRAALVAALGALAAEPAYPALERVARADADATVRAAALRALQASASHDDFLIDVLSADPAPEIRRAAAAALGGRTEADVRRALLAAVKSDADPSVRRTALEVFGKAEHSEVIRGACIALLDDEDPSVRAAAATALAGTKDKLGATCLAKRLAKPEDAGDVRVALLASMSTSPREEVSDALCSQIGPYLRRHVKDTLAHEVPGFDIVEAQNNQHWESSYACVERAMAQGGYSCYARNYLAHWFNQLGGKAKAPWCPGMMRTE